MMYGREKSDPVIVAEKPTNKAASAVRSKVADSREAPGDRQGVGGASPPR